MVSGDGLVIFTLTELGFPLYITGSEKPNCQSKRLLIETYLVHCCCSAGRVRKTLTSIKHDESRFDTFGIYFFFLMVICVPLECCTGTLTDPKITSVSVSLQRCTLRTRLSQFCHRVPKDYTNTITREISQATSNSFVLRTHCDKHNAMQVNSVHIIKVAVYLDQTLGGALMFYI